jgi:hypothetical protein
MTGAIAALLAGAAVDAASLGQPPLHMAVRCAAAAPQCAAAARPPPLPSY